MKLLNDKLKGNLIKPVEHTKVTSLNDFLEKHKALVKTGAEGSMLRQPGSAYKYGHTNSLLKFKAQIDEKGQLVNSLDDDAVIIGYNISKAKTTEGCLGSFNVKWLDKKKFPKDPLWAVGTGLTKLQKCGDFKKTFPIGTIIV